MTFNTYYFNTSISGPTDAGGVWTNDANAFDGSTATGATTTTRGSSALGTIDLQGTGTTAPTSGDGITMVRARVYISANAGSGVLAARVYTSGFATLLGTPSLSNVTGWSDYVTLSVPTGGWTWAKINSLAVSIQQTSGLAGNSVAVARVEIDVASGAPGFDAVSSKIDNVFSTGPTVETWSHTCSGTNRLLVVCVDIWQDVAGTGAVTAASYNGTAMTKVTNTRGNGMASEMWYLINPSSGINTVSVTVTGTTDSIKIGAVSFTNADQTSPLVDFATSVGTSGNPSTSIRTTTFNTVLVSTLSRFSTDPVVSDWTSIYNDVTGSTLGEASYYYAPTAGAYTNAYIGASANDSSVIVASFKSPDTLNVGWTKG